MLTMIVLAVMVTMSVAMVMTGYYDNVDDDSLSSDGGDVSCYSDDWLLR